MNLLEQCSKEFKPVFYRRYIDDIFVLFESSEYLSKYHAYLHTCHLNLSDSFEQKKNAKLSFLDVEVSRKQSKFATAVYRKPNFSSVYGHFEGFFSNGIQSWYDIHANCRCFNIYSDWIKFHEELSFLKNV